MFVRKNTDMIFTGIKSLTDGSLFLNLDYPRLFLIVMALVFMCSILFASTKWKPKWCLTISLLSSLIFVISYNCIKFDLILKRSPYSLYDVLALHGEGKESTAMQSYFFENFRDKTIYTSTLDFGKYLREEKTFSSEWDYKDYIKSVSGIDFKLKKDYNPELNDDQIAMIELFPTSTMKDANGRPWVFLRPECFYGEQTYYVMSTGMEACKMYIVPQKLMVTLHNK